jgi:hypothetical protein
MGRSCSRWRCRRHSGVPIAAGHYQRTESRQLHQNSAWPSSPVGRRPKIDAPISVGTRAVLPTSNSSRHVSANLGADQGCFDPCISCPRSGRRVRRPPSQRRSSGQHVPGKPCPASTRHSWQRAISVRPPGATASASPRRCACEATLIRPDAGAVSIGDPTPTRSLFRSGRSTYDDGDPREDLAMHAWMYGVGKAGSCHASSGHRTHCSHRLRPRPPSITEPDAGGRLRHSMGRVRRRHVVSLRALAPRRWAAGQR